jgi:hypothetical protein
MYMSSECFFGGGGPWLKEGSEWLGGEAGALFDTAAARAAFLVSLLAVSWT